MGTLKQKIQKSLTTKEEIRSAIAAHGVSITESTPFSEYPAKIGSIETGIDTSDGTITANNVLNGCIGYAKGQRIVGKIPSRNANTVYAEGATVQVPSGYYQMSITKSVTRATQATPTMSANANVVTATCTQDEGYVSAGTKSATLTIGAAGPITGAALGTTNNLSESNGITGKGKVSITNVNQAPGWQSTRANETLSIDVPAGRLYCGRTITPSTYNQVAIAAEGIAYEAINVQGDPNLVPANIRRGASIFGVSGIVDQGNCEYQLVDAPIGSRVFSIPWTKSYLPTRIVAFWWEDVVLNGNRYPYFVYSFNYRSGEMYADFELRDGSYHERLGSNEFDIQIANGNCLITVLINQVGFANGYWDAMIGDP